MHALLIAAHGSRRAASNHEVEQLAEVVAAQAGDRYGYYGAAFLELAEPSIEAGLRQCAEVGATRVTLVPYFLAAGRHVAEDIPDIVVRMRKELPGVAIDLAPHLGATLLLASVVLACAG